MDIYLQIGLEIKNELFKIKLNEENKQNKLKNKKDAEKKKDKNKKKEEKKKEKVKKEEKQNDPIEIYKNKDDIDEYGKDLGKGSFGVVKDVKIKNKSYAGKLVMKDVTEEIRLTQELRGPNIIRIQKFVNLKLKIMLRII